MTPHCFTIGYQGRSLEDLCSLLVNYGIDQLVDVRERAWSQRPEYRKTALQNGLATAGIGYVHLKEAGNTFRPRAGESVDFAACMREYRKYLRANPGVVEKAKLVLEKNSIAFFCYEADNAECHRNVLVEEITQNIPELTVDHL